MNYFIKNTCQTKVVLFICFGLHPLFGQNPIWEQTNGPLGGHMSSLALNNSEVLFTGGIGGVFRYTSEYGWTQTNGTVYAILAMTSNSNGQLFGGAWGHGFHRSLDFGETWEREYPINPELNYIKSIDINDDNDIFVSTQGNGVFQSTDLGDSFIAKNIGLSTDDIRACSFNADGHVFAATDSGVFKSVNNGNSWIEINEGLTDLDIHDIAISPNGDIFVISRSFVFRSTDNGENWTQLIFDESVLKIVIAINANGDLFVGVGSGWVHNV